MISKREYEPRKQKPNSKILSLIIVGVLTSIYVVAELAIAIKNDSLVLLSDGFHNLSDVISIGIAYWALVKSNSSASDQMSYGWKRTEVVGALVNACSLLALCLYIVLESIPRFIHPKEIEADIVFLSVAGSGVAVNLIGTILFAITGTHAHSHSHDDEIPMKEEILEDESIKIDINSESTINLDGILEEKKEHDHKHDHEHNQEHDHKHNHEHNHEHNQEHDHKHDHEHDMNMWAVFIHYLGDFISSAFVLATGLLVHFFGNNNDPQVWASYLDPISSLLIVLIILYTAIPITVQCARILLQRVPKSVNLSSVRNSLLKIPNVDGLHDLHVWQLVDGMTISTVHISITSPEYFDHVTKKARKIFHKFNIHSSTIQPEYPRAISSSLLDFSNRSSHLCDQNCSPDCKEDWCCKSAPLVPQISSYDSSIDSVFNPRQPLPPRLNPPPNK